MSDRLLDLVGEARSRWMIGAPGTSGDHPLLQGVSPAEADLRLLAIAGQHRLVHCRPGRPDLSVALEFPELALPLLDEALRPVLKRALARNSEARHGIAVAAFVARRGRMLHPSDWTPPSNPTRLPSVYRAIWVWAHHPTASLSPLSAETWPEIPAALRPVLLDELWAVSPDQARKILRAVFAPLPAEDRFALLETFGARLTAEDTDFLAGLAGDRSGKVKVLAARLLGRLGQAVAPREATQEAAGSFEVYRVGLLRRKTEIRVKKSLNPSQQRSLATALAETSLPELASALGLTPIEFCFQWCADDCPHPVFEVLTELVAVSGRPDELLAFCERSSAHGSPVTLLTHLLPRMSSEQAGAILAGLIDSVGYSGPLLLWEVYGLDLPPSALKAVLGSQIYRDLAELAARASQNTDLVERRRAEHELDPLLDALGLLLPSSEAQGLLDRLIAAGLHPVDPRLSLLSLNASLKG